jgi:hypothetical protein
VLYRPAARKQFKADRPVRRAEPWWSVVLEAPLFLRTLFRLALVCAHRHMGPPITLRESIPSNLRGGPSASGRGASMTCLDCGQRFAYNHDTGRVVDFWGVHDAEALARVRRIVAGFFSPFRGLAARAGRLVDFWGGHDAEAWAGVRRRVAGFFSPLRGLAARFGGLNMRISSQLDRSVRSLGILTKDQWSKSRRLIASKWVPRSNVKETQTRQEHN